MNKLLENIKRVNLNGLLRNPNFYFAAVALVLFGILATNCNELAKLNYLKNSDAVFFNSFFTKTAKAETTDLFFSKNAALPLETPDLKIVQDNCLCGISTPRVLTTQTLGAIFGSDGNKGEISEYIAQSGDTFQSIAEAHKISVNTLLWANNLSKGATLKEGQTLVILPVSGVVHVAKSGDTIGDIAKTYKADADNIVAFNTLAGEGDVYVGDILIIPDGTMPQKAVPAPAQIPLATNFFIFPVEGRITQGLHWYNAVDIANKCGAPVHAAAAGVVQRVRYGWNFGGGNLVTILHSNGVVTYYGHLMTIFVQAGQQVQVGERIALMGGGAGMAGAGISTGCHLHFETIGAVNPLSKYFKGAQIKY